MKILYFLFNIFFFRFFSQIIYNPIPLDVGKYPIVLFTDDNDNYFYILTEGRSKIIDKKTGQSIYINNDFIINQNSLYIVDNSKYNYIINKLDECYKIHYNPAIDFEQIYFKTLNIDD